MRGPSGGTGGGAERAARGAAGARLRWLRERRGVSLAELARLVHYSKGYLSKVENGVKPLTPEVARACDRVLQAAGELAGLAAGPAAGTGSPPLAGPAGAAPTSAERFPPGGAARAGAAGVCVGRDQELATLRSCAAAAAAGSFRVVWVAGEAGAGKSTLAGTFAELVAGNGWQVAWGRCPEVDGAPAGWAWAEVARLLLGSADPPAGESAGSVGGGGAGWVAERLAALVGHEPDGSDVGPAATFWAARALAELLARSAGRRPLLVVLDDVHRDRGESLQLLRHVFTELASCPVLVLATYRPAEATAGVSATQAATTGPRVEQLELGGLGDADVARLLHLHSGVVVPPDDAQTITVRTGGNPLFVSETARLIRAEGVGAATRVVPAGVRNVLRHRLAMLPEPAQATLRTVAVLGLEADVDVLLAVDPAGADTVLDGVESAVRARLLTEPAPGAVRFAHALVRDVVYEDVPLVRRVRLHARALDVLGRRGGAGTAALARHALAAATPATAPAAAALAAKAAQAAVTLSAHQEAAALLQQALRVLDLPGRSPHPAEDHTRLDLLCLLVSAQAHAGNVLAARASRQQAIHVAGKLDVPSEVVRAYAAYDAPALWTVHAYQQVDSTLVDGLEHTLAALPGADDRARCQLLATLAVEVDASDPERAEQASAQAVAVARRLGDPELLCRALNARYIATTLDPDGGAELERIGREQLTTATAAGLTDYQAQGHQILFMAALGHNDLDRAQWHVDRAVEHATSGQLALALSILSMFDALRALVVGRFEDAERTYSRISAQLRTIGDPNALTFDLLVRFCVEHARGGPGTEARMAALADEARPAYDRLGDAISEPYTRLLVGAGRLDEARASWSPRTPVRRDFYWLLWMVFRAENALHLDDIEIAATCYAQLSRYCGQLPEIVHGHVTLGPVDHTLGDLAVALGRTRDATGHYRRAVALADQIGAPHWSTRSRRALARLRHAYGNQPTA